MELTIERIIAPANSTPNALLKQEMFTEQVAAFGGSTSDCMPSHAFIKAIAAVVVTTLGTLSPATRTSSAEPLQNVRLVLPSVTSSLLTETTSHEETFRRLADKWAAETDHLSSPPWQTSNSNYLRIIALGESAIPLILKELEATPRFWFSALEAITGENPVQASDNGDIVAMRDAWLKWGRERELIG